MSNELTAAVAKVVEVLSSLEAGDRVRVVNASLTLLGDVNIDATKSSGAQALGDVDRTSAVDVPGISPQANAWLTKNGLTIDELQNWYHFEPDSVTPLGLPGSEPKRSQQTINTYLLVGFAAYLSTGEASFTDKDARSWCEHFGCYDRTNHSKIYKSFGNKITGSKSSGWKLTVPGLSAAVGLLKGSVQA